MKQFFLATKLDRFNSCKLSFLIMISIMVFFFRRNNCDVFRSCIIGLITIIICRQHRLCSLNSFCQSIYRYPANGFSCTSRAHILATSKTTISIQDIGTVWSYFFFFFFKMPHRYLLIFYRIGINSKSVVKNARGYFRIKPERRSKRAIATT